MAGRYYYIINLTFTIAHTKKQLKSSIENVLNQKSTTTKQPKRKANKFNIQEATCR